MELYEYLYADSKKVMGTHTEFRSEEEIDRLNKEREERKQAEIDRLTAELNALKLQLSEEEINRKLIEQLQYKPPQYVDDPNDFEEVYGREEDGDPLWIKIIFAIMLALMSIGYLVIFFKVGGYGSTTNHLISSTWLAIILIGLFVKRCCKSKK